MNNYMKADLLRIFKRIPRIIVLLIVYFILSSSLLTEQRNGGLNFISINTYIDLILPYLIPLIGMVELLAVYSDDYKAKTLQVAIGIGIPRRNVVLAKLLEMMILVLIDLFLFAAIAIGFGLAFQAELSGEQFGEIIIKMLSVWLHIIGYLSLTTIFMFLMQSTGIGAILFLVLSCNVLTFLIKALLSISFLANLHLAKFMLSAEISIFISRLYLSNFDTAAFLAILIYIIAGYVFTSLAFQKRELDF